MKNLYSSCESLLDFLLLILFAPTLAHFGSDLPILSLKVFTIQAIFEFWFTLEIYNKITDLV